MQDYIADHPPTLYGAGHLLAVATWLGALFGLLPAIAGLFAIMWYSIQIYESDTWQQWMARRRALRKAKQLSKLKAEQKILMAEIEALEVVREAKAVAAEKVEVAKHQAAKQAVQDAAGLEQNAPLD